MLRVGERLGDYEILKRLKAGGMGTLYLGRRTGAAGFVRPVAIKVLQAGLLEDVDSVNMFVEEALLCARIRHPNVVHVEQLGETDDGYYLVMEYVHGLSLSQLLRRIAERERTLSPHFAVYLALQVADGLHAAHELRDEAGEPLGVVHRDVSPSNVLVSVDGHVKLIDFGIAKARTRTPTQHRTLKGKLRYMPPEQAFGRSVDRRADVYALGIVLWELLTGRALFSSEDDFDLLEQVRDPHIPPPATIVSGLAAGIDEAVVKALEVEPAKRFASARAFRDALVEACPEVVRLTPHHVAALARAFVPEDLDVGSGRPAAPRVLFDEPALSESAKTGSDALEISEEKALSTLTVDPRALEPAAAPTVSRRSWNPWLAAAVVLVVAGVGVTLALTGNDEPAAATDVSVPDESVVDEQAEPRQPEMTAQPRDDPDALADVDVAEPTDVSDATERDERRAAALRARRQRQNRERAAMRDDMASAVDGPRLEQAGGSVLIVSDDMSM